METLRRGHQFIVHDVWRLGLPGEPVAHSMIIKLIRVVFLLLRGLVEETLLLRAAALTFATILFIVPFLAFTFFFIQTFNLGDQFYSRMSEHMEEGLTWMAQRVNEPPTLEPGAIDTETASTPAPAPEETTPPNMRLQEQIINTLFPIFAPGKSLGDEMMGQNPVHFLVNLAERGAKNPRAITITGVLFVLSTVVGFMHNVEWSFNRIWGVRRTRSLFRSISDYLMITLLLPFAAALVMGITATLESEYAAQVLGNFSVALRGGQFLVICLTFSMLYLFVPNTRVQVRYALLSGLVAGGLWVVSSWAYMKFQFGLLSYIPFFSGFALFPLMLMWIYVSWVILLFGALLTFAYQNEYTFAMERLAHGASFAYREALAVRVMIELARRFREGLPGLTITAAAHAWHVPTRLLIDTMTCLTARNLVVECATDPVTYQPGRSPGSTRVIDVVQAMREEGQEPSQLRQSVEYQTLFDGLHEADPKYVMATLDELSQQKIPDTPPKEP